MTSSILPPHPTLTPEAPMPSPAPVERDQPLRDWLRELFSSDRDRARQRRAALRASWEAMRDFLMGVHENLLDEILVEGGDPDEAFDHVLDTFLQVVVDDLAQRADERLDWHRVNNTEIRALLEERDGPFIRRLLTVARSATAYKKQRKLEIGSRLIRMLPGPASTPTRSRPTVVQHTEGTVEEATTASSTPAAEETIVLDPGILEADAIEAVPAPPRIHSASAAARRLRSATDDDRAATGRSPADLPGRSQ